MKNRIIDFLMNNADPSIVLRVKKEILNSCSRLEESELINKIVQQKNVQTIINSQKADGWIGNSFHGQSPKNGAGMYDNMEVGLRYLSEKGLTHDNNYIYKAVESILTKEPFDPVYGGKPPLTPDTDYSYTASGLYLARSSILIRAGYEDLLPQNNFIDLKHDIEYSLSCFFNVLNYNDITEVIDKQRKKITFKQSIKWPCIYDLRMLANSQAWRNKVNYSMISKSVEALLDFKNLNDMVYTYKKGQFVGPCFAFIGQQMGILKLVETNDISLDVLELLARCGVVKEVKQIKNKYDYLLSTINPDLSFKIDVDKKKDFTWSPYFGFALSESWKKDIDIQCDILFRILLIIHYAELDI